jgi:hypothetical protein
MTDEEKKVEEEFCPCCHGKINVLDGEEPILCPHCGCKPKYERKAKNIEKCICNYGLWTLIFFMVLSAFLGFAISHELGNFLNLLAVSVSIILVCLVYIRFHYIMLSRHIVLLFIIVDICIAILTFIVMILQKL